VVDVGLVRREGLEQRESAGYLYIFFDGSLTLRHGEASGKVLESPPGRTQSTYRDWGRLCKSGILAHHSML